VDIILRAVYYLVQKYRTKGKEHTNTTDDERLSYIFTCSSGSRGGEWRIQEKGWEGQEGSVLFRKNLSEII